MEVPREAAEQRDWLALPAGVLQRSFCLASTWQAPGSCLAAPVCRNWRSAVAGCRDICLLFHVGHSAADQSFATWLGRNSPQLEALILTSSNKSIELILTALAEAAAAAQAAGTPLQLRALRVLQGGVHPQAAGQLVAGLPRLRCLQLGISAPRCRTGPVLSSGLLEALAPLQAATQLEQLYLKGPGTEPQGMAGLLPLSLKRLSWDPEQLTSQADLSHLTQLTFLRLNSRSWYDVTSSRLPPGLQQLEVVGGDIAPLEVLEEQRQVVTALDTMRLEAAAVQQLLHRLPKLQTLNVTPMGMCDKATWAALQQLTQLSAMTLNVNFHPIKSPGGKPSAMIIPAVAAAASMSSLRRLHLCYGHLPPPPALDVLTQLTQLRVTTDSVGGSNQQQQRAWAEVVGRMAGLRWLSVPDVLLTAGQAWLGGLQQLRVLVVRCKGTPEGCLPWLEGCSREVLPPRLQLLGVCGTETTGAVSWQVRRRLQQALGASGCEVVVGVDLDEVADPVKQLAGVPAALQQALA